MIRIVTGITALLLASGLPTLAAAEQVPGVVSLSPEERAAVLDAAASRPDRNLPLNGIDRAPHEEVGFEIGSRGERALFGSTVVPLGDHGTAAFSFMTGQTGRWAR